MTSNPIGTSSNLLKTKRKEELLSLARRARSQWIFETISPIRIEDLELETNTFTSSNYSKINTSLHHSNTSNNKILKVPAAQCIDNLLDYLTNIIDDGFYINVETIVNRDDEAGKLLDSMIWESNDQDESDPQKNTIQSDNIKNYSDLDGYIQFCDKLRRSSAFEIVRLIQQFQTKIETTIREERKVTLALKYSDDFYLNLSSTIYSFINHIEEQCKVHPILGPFMSSLEETKTDNRLHDYIERLVFSKLHHLIFNIDTEDFQLNQKLNIRMKSLKFLSPEHLDLNIKSKGQLKQPLVEILAPCVKKLMKLNVCKNPSDIMYCVKDTMKEISNILRKLHQNEFILGADDYLPFFILVVKSCEIPTLNSIMKYLYRFLHESKLQSELGYLFTQFVSAIQFLETVDAKALTISPDEYENSINRCKQEADLIQEKLSKKWLNRRGKELKFDKTCQQNDVNHHLENMPLNEALKTIELHLNKCNKKIEDLSKFNNPSATLQSMYFQDN